MHVAEDLFLEHLLALCQVVVGPRLRAHFEALYEGSTWPKTQGPSARGARDKWVFQGFLALEGPASTCASTVAGCCRAVLGTPASSVPGCPRARVKGSFWSPI